MYHAETLRSCGLPEVLVGLHVGVIVAVRDEAQGNKGDTLQVAGLCQGSGFHIYGKGIGEVAQDELDILAVFYEFVTGGNEAWNCSKLCRLLDKLLWSRKPRRKALNLAVHITFSIPGVVKYYLTAHYKISCMDTMACGTSHAR